VFTAVEEGAHVAAAVDRCASQRDCPGGSRHCTLLARKSQRNGACCRHREWNRRVRIQISSKYRFACYAKSKCIRHARCLLCNARNMSELFHEGGAAIV